MRSCSSLRSGLATSAAIAGTSERSIMNQTGASVGKYGSEAAIVRLRRQGRREHLGRPCLVLDRAKAEKLCPRLERAQDRPETGCQCGDGTSHCQVTRPAANPARPCAP
jgi:hypothetical protein